jgi:hypothetical protein
MMQYEMARLINLDHDREAERYARRQALLAEVDAGAAATRPPVRRRVAAWVGVRLICLGRRLGAAPGGLTPQRP